MSNRGDKTKGNILHIPLPDILIYSAGYTNGLSYSFIGFTGPCGFFRIRSNSNNSQVKAPCRQGGKPAL